MALDKLVDSTQLDSDLTSVANAIRTKGGTNSPLAFPSDFVSAINALQVFHEYSGSIANFTTASATSLLKLIVAIEPVQSGTGTPAPDNVRPISGWDDVNIWVQPTHDTSANPTVTVDLNGTRYGGTLDVVTGVLTVNRAHGRLTTMTGISSGAYPFVYGSTTTNGLPVPLNLTSLMCNTLRPRTNVYDSAELGFSVLVATNGTIRLRLPGVSSVAGGNQWLSDNPTYVCFEVSSFPVQLSAETVSTLVGANNVWADAGDITLWYAE